MSIQKARMPGRRKRLRELRGGGGASPQEGHTAAAAAALLSSGGQWLELAHHTDRGRSGPPGVVTSKEQRVCPQGVLTSVRPLLQQPL